MQLHALKFEQNKQQASRKLIDADNLWQFLSLLLVVFTLTWLSSKTNAKKFCFVVSLCVYEWSVLQVCLGELVPILASKDVYFQFAAQSINFVQTAILSLVKCKQSPCTLIN